MRYDYLTEIKNEVENYLTNELENIYYDCADRDELEQELYDNLFVSDAITGNASGSYFCNSYKAMECVIDNMDLLKNMCQEFGIDNATIGEKFINEEWEWMDVSIRCHLLSQAISEVLDDISDELEEYFERKEEELDEE